MRKGLIVDTAGSRFYLAVVGESHYQENIGYVTEKGRWRIFNAMLIPEPENSHDRNAVRVDGLAADGVWLTIGYLDRRVAKSISPAMDALPQGYDGFACQGAIRGGEEGKMYGVWLNLPVS